MKGEENYWDQQGRERGGSEKKRGGGIVISGYEYARCYGGKWFGELPFELEGSSWVE